MLLERFFFTFVTLQVRRISMSEAENMTTLPGAMRSAVGKL